ncbi:MAG: serine O-acetyltransferase [Methanobrevibacter arboriphilus]|jgi:serine O-acetyltransferase|uniref:serine O-acetyltransferase n=2 Tax=Methanobrevibacter arboriphilus TaxID=39441 RepID=A0A843AAV6_METAZ|nr:serine O-acetyltransferase [Methanobrevibacter arboriphilus]MBF4468497.1 serine O-acetyltransferase [Methanobrevibacter arboriphilus]MCC7562369.1 serine O-acetyltransferase [Methanobrevibacter arboriphilus]BBL61116.1 serine acetyltransferase [Methanobrevibacter arboriphilus]
MFKRIKEDLLMVHIRDPAARSSFEIFFCYSGIHAIWYHLISHYLWNHGHYFSARLIASINRFFTGIEIHPAAKVGRRVFIDHGMGVVIGETAEIGDDVLMYQGVVLGGTSTVKEKRHPTVGNGVVIGSGALVIGNIYLGNGSKIGAGSVVLKDVPMGSTVVGVPGRVVHEKRKCAMDQEHQKLPDPVEEKLEKLVEKQEYLEKEIESLKKNK